jgi:hypothetical protein
MEPTLLARRNQPTASAAGGFQDCVAERDELEPTGD